MSFYQDGAISSCNYEPLELVDQFIYISSHISSTEKKANIYMSKA